MRQVDEQGRGGRPIPSTIPGDFIELMQSRAATNENARAFVFLADGKRESSTLTFGELDQQARALAAHLQAEAGQGDRILLLYPAGLEAFVAFSAFSACLLAGVVAVPAPPPEDVRLKRSLPRLASIVTDSEPRLVLTTPELLPTVEAAMQQVTHNPSCCLATSLGPIGRDPNERDPHGRDPHGRDPHGRDPRNADRPTPPTPLADRARPARFECRRALLGGSRLGRSSSPTIVIATMS